MIQKTKPYPKKNRETQPKASSQNPKYLMSEKVYFSALINAKP